MDHFEAVDRQLPGEAAVLGRRGIVFLHDFVLKVLLGMDLEGFAIGKPGYNVLVPLDRGVLE